MQPTVSVLLTVYKRTEYLLAALESAINQTYQSREILVLDDSGDRAAEDLCAPYVAAGRISYHANPKTLGIAISVRDGLRRAQGSFISILNDDDVWEPEFLQRLTPHLQADASRVLAFSEHWIMDANGTVDAERSKQNAITYGRSSLGEGEIADPAEFVLVKNGVPLAMASVFRKDAVAPALLCPEVAGAYDFWISCVLAASGGSFYYVPECLTRYRIHSQMETGRRSPDKSDNQVFIYTLILQKRWFSRLNSHLRFKNGDALFRAGKDRLFFNQPLPALRYFARSFWISPGWRPIVGASLCMFPQGLRKRLGQSA